MDSPVLVTDEIASGTEALRRLDEANIEVTAALWLYDDAAAEWRYVVATPLADQEGPRELYQRIDRALANPQAKPRVPIWRLVTLSPKNQLLELLKRLIGKLENPAGLSLTLQMPGGGPTNVLVYRMG